MKSPKEVVLDKYPKAIAKYAARTNEIGQSQPIVKGRWNIYRDNKLEQPILGQGGTEKDAWANAAKLC